MIVICWKYLDGSAAGTLGIYATEEIAAAVFTALLFHGDGYKEFTLYKSGPNGEAILVQSGSGSSK